MYPYIRVSTTEQESNYREGAQRFSAENFLKNHLVKEEFVLGDSVREMGVSAFKVKIMNRAEFQKLLAKLKAGDGIYFGRQKGTFCFWKARQAKGRMSPSSSPFLVLERNHARLPTFCGSHNFLSAKRLPVPAGLPIAIY